MPESVAAEPKNETFFDFDKLEIPLDLGEMKFNPPAEMWDRYRAHMGDPRVFITNAMRPRSMMTYRMLPTRPTQRHVNCGHEARYFNEPIEGKSLILRSRIVDKYVRRGKPYVVTETEVEDEDGRKIETHRRTSMVSSPKLGKKWWAQPTSDTEIGAKLEPISRTFTLAMMTEFEAIYGYASGRPQNFHNNEAEARAAGLRAPIASAHMTISNFHALLNKFFGNDWIKGGTISVKFIRPVLAGDTVTYGGAIKEKVTEGERTRLMLDVWAENQNGERTSLGTASGLVD